MAVERKEEKTEETVANKHSHTARNRVDQATGEVNTIFGVRSVWVNNSAPPSAPHTLVIPGGAARTMTQQSTRFPEGGNSPTTGTTAQTVHRTMM